MAKIKSIVKGFKTEITFSDIDRHTLEIGDNLIISGATVDGGDAFNVLNKTVKVTRIIDDLSVEVGVSTIGYPGNYDEDSAEATAFTNDQAGQTYPGERAVVRVYTDGAGANFITRLAPTVKINDGYGRRYVAVKGTRIRPHGRGKHKRSYMTQGNPYVLAERREVCGKGHLAYCGHRAYFRGKPNVFIGGSSTKGYGPVGGGNDGLFGGRSSTGGGTGQFGQSLAQQAGSAVGKFGAKQIFGNQVFGATAPGGGAISITGATSGAIGGAIGGAVGGAIGGAIAGEKGAFVGSAVGTIVGVAIATGKFICSELQRQGHLKRESNQLCLTHARQHLTPYHVVGYQSWSKSQVRWMRNSKMITRFWLWMTIHYRNHCKSKLNYPVKKTWQGTIIAGIGEPITYTIGKLKVWKNKTVNIWENIEEAWQNDNQKA